MMMTRVNVVDDDVDDDTDADNCVDDEDTCEEAGKSNNQFVSVCRGVALCDRGPGGSLRFLYLWFISICTV